MGIFDKLERSIERGVNGVFAKAFRAEVQPVEIASAMRRAMDDRAVSAGKGKRHVVPNLFVVELSTTDYEGLVTEHEDELADDLIATASEHAESQRYQPGGPVSVQFSEDEDLETGVFRLRPSNARQVQPNMRRMPERMPPARDVDDPRAPRGQEPPPPADRVAGERSGGAYRDPAPQPRDLETPPPLRSSGSSATSMGQPAAPLRSSGSSATSMGQPAAPLRSSGSPSIRPSQAPGYSGQRPAPAVGQPESARKRDDYRPSPAAPRKLRQRPWLDVDGDRYPMLGAITVIGRDDDADILLDDPGISRRHSEIRITYDGPHQVITIRDLGSTNGTFVNGDPIGTMHLSEGDRITIGRTHLVVHEGGTR